MPAKTKALTLPSGATCTIHSPSRFSDMAAGVPPKSLTRQTPTDIVEQRALSKPELDYLVAVARAKLLTCVSPLVTKEGTRRLVDKPFWELKSGEMCIEDLDQADADLLSNEIDALREEAAVQAEKFPENVAAPEAGTPDAGRNGETLRETAKRAGPTAA